MKPLIMCLLLAGIAFAANTTNLTNQTVTQSQGLTMADFNFVAILLWTIGFCLLFPLGWVIGRLQDLNWRCKRMRQFLKKDYRLLKYKFKGSKTLFARIVDVTSGVITVGQQQWVMAGDRMYLESNQKVGLSIKKLDKDPAYDDGCPVIYVDADNITPLEFQGDGTNVRPEELGSTYSGYLLNQLAKALSFVKNLKTMLMILVFGVAICAIFIYMTHTDVADIKTNQAKMQTEIDNMSAIINPSTAPVTPVVIKQGGTHG